MSDLINRLVNIEDVIDAIHAYWEEKQIEISVAECGFGEAYTNFMKFNETLEHSKALVNKVNELQTIKVGPFHHGQWIKKPFEYLWSCSECGESAKTIITDVNLVDCNDPSGETGGHFEYDTDTFLSKYCPNCGARMDIEEREEE